MATENVERKINDFFFAIQNRWKLKVFSANSWDERNISNIRKVKEVIDIFDILTVMC